ncbi:hypothetical protein CLOM_g1857 [Closterium sp. NIES-68]|nr:hypothetical protein CLOM_g1857 [Closterium sp. NIES-68]
MLQLAVQEREEEVRRQMLLEKQGGEVQRACDWGEVDGRDGEENEMKGPAAVGLSSDSVESPVGSYAAAGDAAATAAVAAAAAAASASDAVGSRAAATPATTAAPRLRSLSRLYATRRRPSQDGSFGSKRSVGSTHHSERSIGEEEGGDGEEEEREGRAERDESDKASDQSGMESEKEEDEEEDGEEDGEEEGEKEVEGLTAREEAMMLLWVLPGTGSEEEEERRKLKIRQALAAAAGGIATGALTVAGGIKGGATAGMRNVATAAAGGIGGIRGGARNVASAAAAAASGIRSHSMALPRGVTMGAGDHNGVREGEGGGGRARGGIGGEVVGEGRGEGGGNVFKQTLGRVKGTVMGLSSRGIPRMETFRATSPKSPRVFHNPPSIFRQKSAGAAEEAVLVTRGRVTKGSEGTRVARSKSADQRGVRGEVATGSEALQNLGRSHSGEVVLGAAGLPKLMREYDADGDDDYSEDEDESDVNEGDVNENGNDEDVGRGSSDALWWGGYEEEEEEEELILDDACEDSGETSGESSRNPLVFRATREGEEEGSGRGLEEGGSGEGSARALGPWGALKKLSSRRRDGGSRSSFGSDLASVNEEELEEGGEER